ncbi:hypothetical protein STEG23_029537 [Scotinomys teguina]
MENWLLQRATPAGQSPGTSQTIDLVHSAQESRMQTLWPLVLMRSLDPHSDPIGTVVSPTLQVNNIEKQSKSEESKEQSGRMATLCPPPHRSMAAFANFR